MDSLQFTFWLQGFFELTDSKTLTDAQVAMIKEHLQLTFKKVTNPLQTLPYTQLGGTTTFLSGSKVHTICVTTNDKPYKPESFYCGSTQFLNTSESLNNTHTC